MKLFIRFLMGASLAMVAFAADEKIQTLERHFAVTPKQRVDILGFRGAKIEFHTWEKNEVYVKLDVQISASDNDYESEYIKSLRLSELSSTDALTIEFHEPEFRDRGSSFFKRLFNFSGSFMNKEIRGDIYIPAGNALTVDFRYGTASFEEMKGAINFSGESNKLKFRNCANVQTIENNYGNITLQNCGGSLSIRSQSSTVTVDEFNGPFDIQSDYSTISVNKATKGGLVESQSGKHTFTDIAGNLTVKSNYSKINARNVSGFVDISTSSGTVILDQAQGVHVNAPYSQLEISSIDGKSGKRVEITDQSGKIELRDIVGDVFIDDQYSSIALDNVKGNVELSSQSATISADNISGDWKSRTEYSKINIAALGGTNVSISNSSGTVDVQMAARPNSVSITNQYANVTLGMTKGFSGNYKLKSKYGTISSNLSMEIDDLGGGQIASGKIGNGTGTLRIDTESGNIKVTER
jgi:hypothetical protein